MKRMKKWLIGGLAVAAAATMALGLAACNDDTEEEENKPPVTETAEIEWQFTGHYTDETLTGFGFDYYILLNLLDDGTVAGSGYNILSMDSSDYAENSGFSEKWWTGSWEETKNSEGLDCIKLSVRYDEDAENIMGGGFATSRFEYELYPTSEGTITFTLDCPIFSGRQQQVTGSKTVKYKDFDAFIQGNLYVFEEPEYVVMFATAADNHPGRLYLQDDGTALFYVGNIDPATNQAKYVISQTWTWTYESGKLVVKTGATSQIEATIEGTKATIKYDRNAMGNIISYTMECADISALEDIEPPAPETPEVVAAFSGDKKGTIALLKDGTGTMSPMGYFNIDVTWTYSGGKLVITDAENASKTYTATIEGAKATVTYSDTLQGNSLSETFTCDDISAITSTPEAPETILTFKGEKGGSLVLYKDGTGVMNSQGIHPMDITWTYENGTLTITETDGGNKHTAVIEGKKATVTYTASFGTFDLSDTFVCDDITPLTK